MRNAEAVIGNVLHSHVIIIAVVICSVCGSTQLFFRAAFSAQQRKRKGFDSKTNSWSRIKENSRADLASDDRGQLMIKPTNKSKSRVVRKVVGWLW